MSDSNRDWGASSDEEIMRRNILSKVRSRKEFFTLEDGFYHYWPNHGGAMSSRHLRIIADELDRLNKPVQEELDRFFAS